jgi:hypothetical protein
MNKKAQINKSREESTNLHNLLGNKDVPSVSADWAGMFPIYTDSMEDKYAEKTASVKEAGMMSDMLQKLKVWWDDRKKERADVSEDKPELKQASVFEDPSENNYWAGFVEKCAETNVDPRQVVQLFMALRTKEAKAAEIK